MKSIIKIHSIYLIFLNFLPDKIRKHFKRIINANLVFQLILHPLNFRLIKENLSSAFKKQRIKFHRIIEKQSKIKDFFFIQIGSNDGKLGDPIHDYIIKYNWSGILIEPIKYIYNKLLRTYEKQKNLTIENVAISDKNEIRTFYRLKENKNGLPIWYEQLGTFFLEILLSHKKQIHNIEDYLITEEVNCVTFNELVRKHNVRKIDLLHIDTEGYDDEIIKSIDFTKIRPNIILYENKHLKNED